MNLPRVAKTMKERNGTRANLAICDRDFRAIPSLTIHSNIVYTSYLKEERKTTLWRGKKRVNQIRRWKKERKCSWGRGIWGRPVGMSWRGTEMGARGFFVTFAMKNRS